MSRQRQLNALLFELQAARTPLERARILARAWRSVRDLSASDRRLLARYAAFDGAEELIENLARRSGGTAPALLLRALSSVERDDGGAVARLVGSLRGGAPLSEVAVEAVDAAAALAAGQEPQETAPADPPLAAGSREAGAGEAAAVAAAMAALGEVGRQAAPDAGPGEHEHSGRDEAAGAVAETRKPDVPRHEAAGGRPGARESAPAVPKAALMAEWSEVGRPATPDVGVHAEAGRARLEEPDQPEGVAAEGLRAETESVLERFGRLHSKLEGRPVVRELRELALSFPDGWQRRRAVSYLLASEAVRSVEESLELVATLKTERDRRWCLGVLLGRHPVSPSALAEMLADLESTAARRRLSAMARSR